MTETITRTARTPQELRDLREYLVQQRKDLKTTNEASGLPTDAPRLDRFIALVDQLIEDAERRSAG